MKKHNSTNLFISIVIAVRDAPVHLQKCLTALTESGYSDYECIVVDDDSTDNTLEVARQFAIKLLKLLQNHGPAYARNEGANMASGDILFFIDADVLLYPDTLTKIANVFKDHPEIDAVIGSYDDAPGDASFISQYKNLFHHYVHQNSNEGACTFWSGCGAIRREIFSKYNGFDTSFGRPAIEDIELGFRLRTDHHKIVLKKDIQVKHLKRWTLWGLIKTDVFDRAVPWTVIMLRDRSFPKDLNLQMSQRFCVFLVYLMLFSVGVLTLPFHLPGIFSLFPFLILVILVSINHKFYKFFLQKRGLRFTVKVIPFHILYYFYSGLGLVLGIISYYLEKRNKKMEIVSNEQN